MTKKIQVEYFTDILCIWAYGAQIRIEQLQQDFPEQVTVTPRYIPLFASTGEHIDKGWADKGGFAGFSQHTLDVARDWDHVRVHPNIWTGDVPASSTSTHLFIKAVQLLEQQGTLAWNLRKHFFAEQQNIARREVQCALAESMNLPVSAIQDKLNCGEAHAALHADIEAQKRYQVAGSPTLILNEGRQQLYGNVGYRIIEANMRELLHNPQFGEASWC
ncbi:MAG: disulfide bond formation protein DsbA [Halothiobacillus sp. 15-55-196]|uniref:DsbA family oxidoreductase n=1 Tax=Halothiobacillus sp. 15-55-196 TaxID=1970382 RepID=UPI000BD359E5|nr:DsbA family protein [Halothiobacillus sp. 15-55-196]OZB35646.1 MAG: disulfide bond formation protein DsbA [Halothiobacillus sp. 15-55-196]